MSRVGAYVAIRCPARLAWYMATSARRSSSAMPPLDGATEIPPLASTLIRMPSSSNGSCRAASRVSARCAATAGAGRPRRSTANSSPPRRATRSLAWAAPRNRSATCTSTWSPAACPSVSLTSLKWLRSISTSAVTPSACRVLNCSVPSSRRCRRLARPVSASCAAAYACSSATRASSAYAWALRTAVQSAEAKVRRVYCSRSESCTGPRKRSRSMPTSTVRSWPSSGAGTMVPSTSVGVPVGPSKVMPPVPPRTVRPPSRSSISTSSAENNSAAWVTAVVRTLSRSTTLSASVVRASRCHACCSVRPRMRAE